MATMMISQQQQLQAHAQRPTSCPLPASHPHQRPPHLARPPRPRSSKPKRPYLRRGMTSTTPTPPSSSSIPPEGASRLPDVEPCFGQLLHLPTRAEAQAILTLGDAYVLEVPVKGANDILL